MHHFSYVDKIKVYTKIFNALKDKGQYIECDYMVKEQEEEDFYFSEYRRIVFPSHHSKFTPVNPA